MFKRLKRRWEGYCKQCGKCCYEKYLLPSGKIETNYDRPCEHLDEEGKFCRVYAQRFRVCDACRKVTLFHALFARYMPDDCGYVEHFRFWRRWGKKPSGENSEAGESLSS